MPITFSAPLTSEIAAKASRQCCRAETWLSLSASFRAFAKQTCSFSLAAFIGSSSCWTNGRSCGYKNQQCFDLSQAVILSSFW